MEGISPIPLVGCEVVIPAGDVLVQANVVPVTVLLITFALDEKPEQIDSAWFVIEISGIGFVVTVTTVDVAVLQSLPVAETNTRK